jgi:exosortase A-associated hydrolase 2
MTGALSVEFVGRADDGIFVLLRRPSSASSNPAVLVVPPFGEEMNKSRPLVADTARRISTAGMAVLIPDFFGTGDSRGEFVDASLDRWLRDLDAACRWSEEKGCPVQAVLAVRLGCAIAVRAALDGMLPALVRTVFLQPVLDGRRFLDQLLRVKVAATMMGDGERETVKSLREQFAQGKIVEVAGYAVSSALAAEVDALRIDKLPLELGRVQWIEVAGDGQNWASPAVERIVEMSRRDGREVELSAVQAEPFWSTVEIVRSPNVVEAIARALT